MSLTLTHDYIATVLVANRYASSDAYSLQPTPRASNFNEAEAAAVGTPVWARSPVGGKVFRQSSPAFSGIRMVWESPGSGGGGDRQWCRDVVGGTCILSAGTTF